MSTVKDSAIKWMHDNITHSTLIYFTSGSLQAGEIITYIRLIMPFQIFSCF